MTKQDILLACVLAWGLVSAGFTKPIRPDPDDFRPRLEDSAVELRRLIGHTGFVNMAAWSADGEHWLPRAQTAPSGSGTGEPES